jgi:hypothetical protein
VSSIHDYEPIITIPSVHADGPLALYRGWANAPGLVHLDLGSQIVTTSAQGADLTALAKAILNETEPEALVANQKAAEPSAPEFKVGDRVRVTAFAEGDQWHNHVGGHPRQSSQWRVASRVRRRLGGL